MSFTVLLKLQFAYFCMGMGFNLLSVLSSVSGKMAFTPTPPVVGIGAMILYLGVLACGYMDLLTAYWLGMILAVGLFGHAGVLKHFDLLQKSPELYYSVFVGVVGLLINLYGVLLNGIAVFGMHKIV